MKVQVRGGKIPPKEHKKLLTEDAVDYILERLIFSKASSWKNVRSECKFTPHQMGPLWAASPYEEDDRGFFHPDAVNHPKLVWPLSFGAVFRGRDGNWGDHLHCIYAMDASPVILRGRCKFAGKHNMAMYEGILDKNNTWFSVLNYASWHWGAWRDAGLIRYDEAFLRNVRPEGGAPSTAGHPVDEGEMPLGDRAAMFQSMALTYRYEWGAQFSIDSSAKIIIPVTPAGVLELFNDRNKPQDNDRRAALRHWVSRHMRSTSGGNFSEVRRHLRGETRFSWRGFDVVIRPSQFDEDRNLQRVI